LNVRIVLKVVVSTVAPIRENMSRASGRTSFSAITKL
jgi:hypothetical protein